MRNTIGSWLLALSIASTAIPGAAADTRVADAAQQGNRNAIRMLIQQRADVNAAQPDGTTALHWAARSEDAELTAMLIKAGANVKAANRFGMTPLAVACTSGNAAIIEQLLQAGEDANAVFTQGGDTALMTAARAGKVDAIRVLLNHGADVNKANARGQTPLMWAVADKNAAAAKLLIEKGANVNAHTNPLPPPGKLDLIFSAPAPPGGMTALLFAVRQNDMESVKVLLAGGADLKQTAADGTTPLLIAIINAHRTLAKYLLDQGADPNMADDKGRTPLYAAIDMRNLEWSTRPAPPEKDPFSDLDLIQALLEKGANVNAKLTKKLPLRGQPSFDGRWANQAGATPFWRAAQSDDVTVMRLLLKYGANPLEPSADKTTPLMVAAGVGWSDGQSHGSQAEAPEAIQICLDAGADINAVNDDGYTALHGASFRGANEVVQFLVDHGARMDIKNKEGRMPINMAEGMHIGPGGWVEHEDTVALFKKLMAKANTGNSTQQAR
jgi:ankyrin repeat protein